MLTTSKPPGLRYLYIAIAGHAFAWYTLYNLFVYWLLHKGLSESAAQAQYGNLVLAAYLLPLLGGLLASGAVILLPWGFKAKLGGYPKMRCKHGKWTSYHVTVAKLELLWRKLAIPELGPRRTAILGGCLAMLGYAAITYTDHTLAPLTHMLAAVGLVTLGVGLSKPNIAALVGRLFPAGSEHAGAAFAVYYSFINIGAVDAPVLGGYLSEHVSFAAAFAPAVLGEAVVVGALLFGKRALMAAESPSSLAAAIGPVEVEGQEKLPDLPGTMAADHVGTDADPARAAEMAALKRRKLTALWLFFAFAAFGFWPAYSQNGSGLNIWAQSHTDRQVFGWEMPAAWFAAINSVICIVATVPLLRLFKRASLSLSTAVGYLLMAASFGLLLAAPYTAAHPGWLTGSIVLSSISEVLISTVGLAQVAKLAPRHQTSTYMAVWMLTTAIGGKLAGIIGLHMQLRAGFALLTGVALIAAVLTLACRQWLDLTEETEAVEPEPVTV